LGERLLCKQEVIGSIPFTSTSARGAAARIEEAQLPSRSGVLAEIFDRVNREYLSSAGWWAG
jgi:hypothetical protein